jgi:hypothetical protein
MCLISIYIPKTVTLYVTHNQYTDCKISRSQFPPKLCIYYYIPSQLRDGLSGWNKIFCCVWLNFTVVFSPQKNVDKSSFKKGRYHRYYSASSAQYCSRTTVQATAVSPVCLASFQSGSAKVRKLLDYTHICVKPTETCLRGYSANLHGRSTILNVCVSFIQWHQASWCTDYWPWIRRSPVGISAGTPAVLI